MASLAIAGVLASGALMWAGGWWAEGHGWAGFTPFGLVAAVVIELALAGARRGLRAPRGARRRRLRRLAARLAVLGSGALMVAGGYTAAAGQPGISLGAVLVAGAVVAAALFLEAPGDHSTAR